MDIAEITGSWDYKTLPKSIHIGKNCWIERKDSFERFRSTRNPGLIICDGVRIYTWTVFNVEPDGRVEIGRDSILVGAVFMCAESITIGENVAISYNVTIADCDFHPKDPALRKQDAIANAPEGDRSRRPFVKSNPVVIEDAVQVGIGAIILKGVRIGRGARIEAGAVVTSDVPEGSVIAGNPAKIVGRRESF